VNVSAYKGAFLATLAQLDRGGQGVTPTNSGTIATLSTCLPTLADAAKLIAFLALALDRIGCLRVSNAFGLMATVQTFRQTLGLAVWTGALSQLSSNV
jgi:hypothetical protein